MQRRLGGQRRPLICLPLTARTPGDILIELTELLLLAPDAVEWRADFFAALDDLPAVIATTRAIKQQAGDLPVIFTIRSAHEGGQPVSLTPDQLFDVLMTVCRETNVDFVDCELACSPDLIQQLQLTAHQHNIAVIGSFHDFQSTPPAETLLSTLRQAEIYGLDAAKIAVMPQSEADVLTLLQVTLRAKTELSIPLITMSMGPLGVSSRLLGGLFGSCLTFAAGRQASAPGQIPINELRTVLDILDKYQENCCRL